MDGVNSFGEARGTGAPLDVVHNDTFGVGAAGVGLALLHWLHAGDGWGIALKPGQAVADRTVGNHPAAGVWSALVASTSLAVLDTPDEWVSCLASWTGADGIAVIQLADCSNSTRGGDAGVGWLLDERAPNVRVSVVPRPAGADGVVVGEAAVGVGAAELAAAHRKALPTEPVAVPILSTVRVYEAL